MNILVRIVSLAVLISTLINLSSSLFCYKCFPCPDVFTSDVLNETCTGAAGSFQVCSIIKDKDTRQVNRGCQLVSGLATLYADAKFETTTCSENNCNGFYTETKDCRRNNGRINGMSIGLIGVITSLTYMLTK